MQQQIIRFFIVMALSALGTWYAAGLYHAQELATLQGEYDGFKNQVVENDLNQARHDLAQMQAQNKEREEQREKILTAERDHDAKIKIETAKLIELRNCVHSGGCGLRYVTAKTPIRDDSVPAVTKADPGDDGGACGLSADAEQAYFTIRETLIEQREQIELLQAYALAVSSQ